MLIVAFIVAPVALTLHCRTRFDAEGVAVSHDRRVAPTIAPLSVASYAREKVFASPSVRNERMMLTATSPAARTPSPSANESVSQHSQMPSSVTPRCWNSVGALLSPATCQSLKSITVFLGHRSMIETSCCSLRNCTSLSSQPSDWCAVATHLINSAALKPIAIITLIRIGVCQLSPMWRPWVLTSLRL